MIRSMVLAIMGGMLCLSVASAQPDADAPHARGPMGHGKMMERLKLTDAQKTDMEKLRAEFEKKSIATQANIRTLRVDLRQFAMAEEPDRAAIERTVQNISKLQLQEKMDLIDHLFSVRKILTPEQRKIWKHGLMRMAAEGRGRFRDGMMNMRMGMQDGKEHEAPEHSGSEAK